MTTLVLFILCVPVTNVCLVLLLVTILIFNYSTLLLLSHFLYCFIFWLVASQLLVHQVLFSNLLFFCLYHFLPVKCLIIIINNNNMFGSLTGQTIPQPTVTVGWGMVWPVRLESIHVWLVKW